MKKLQLDQLKNTIDVIHAEHGDGRFTMTYRTGCTKDPDLLLLFMNPTGKNTSTDPDWEGIRAGWVGTKNIWKFLNNLKLLSDRNSIMIATMKPKDWDPAFAEKIYGEIADNKIYITNLGRCTQADARHVPDAVFQASRDVTLEEIALVNPAVIIAFGNQVASNLLQKPIKVSDCRKKKESLLINGKEYVVYPTYYPVGMGMRNIDKAIEDVKWIMQRHNIKN